MGEPGGGRDAGVGAGAASPAFLEESAEDLFEHAPCGYLTTLLDGTIVRVNRTFCSWTGHEREALVGRRRFQELLTVGGRIFHETHYAPMLRMQGAVREIALDLVAADGRQMPVLVNATVRHDHDGRPVVIRTTVFDATERRQYERELVRARQAAEEAEARATLLARTLQESLIPPALPIVPGVEVAGVYRPAGRGDEVGGDFFDVFEAARGDWAVVLGDVCGKGAEAATVTALARYTIRATAIRTRRPRQVLATLNRALLRQHEERFCTVVYGRLRPSGAGRAKLTVAAGGHPLPVLARATGDPVAIGRPGSLLGVLDAPSLHDVDVELGPGDVVAFFTDGITEARKGREFFGHGRLTDLVGSLRSEPAAVIAERVVAVVVDLQGGRPRDDIALVVLKVPPLAA